MRATITTFGCKVNQYESEALRDTVSREGYTLVDEGNVELHVVNTCTVTESAARDALRLVRRLGRRHPGRRFRIAGCAAKTHADAFARLPGVEAVVPHEPGRLQRDSIAAFSGHARAFVKIQDGCNLECSFCIIPTVRGGSESRRDAAVVEEVRALVAAGHREIVLTGVHLGGFDGLPRLIERLLDVDGLGRLRLSSIEANEATDELLSLMAAEPRICPHLHVPLQSGDATVLRAMRRRYNPRMFMETVDRIRAALDEPALSTDVIVGFPGEDAHAFERTLDLCERAGFMRIHVFPYSPRAGTDAAARPDDVPPREKRRRAQALKVLAAAQADAFARRFVGREVEVLVERGGGGYTERYVPARTTGSGLVRGVARDYDGELILP